MESKIFAKLNFDPGILVILSLVISIVLIIVVVQLVLKLQRLESNYNTFMKGKNGRSLENVFKEQLDNLDNIHEQTDLLHKRMLYVEKSLNKSYQKMGIVRYDAFKEIGGKLSFAYALLNDSNTGFVMNCIHSREGSYTYIKDIVRGECELPLSDEETEAVQSAIVSTTLQASVKKSRKDESEESGIKSLTASIEEISGVDIGNITEKVKKKVPKKAAKKNNQNNTNSDSALKNESDNSQAEEHK